jgi:hypothetical protein
MESQRGQWLHLLLFFGERTQASGKEDPMNPDSTRKHVRTIIHTSPQCSPQLCRSRAQGGGNCFSGLCGGVLQGELWNSIRITCSM